MKTGATCSNERYVCSLVLILFQALGQTAKNTTFKKKILYLHWLYRKQQTKKETKEGNAVSEKNSTTGRSMDSTLLLSSQGAIRKKTSLFFLFLF
ncbi:MAG: hypothetical protein J3R72DRAFT_11660 [Linnemannia gamsii]|nr:MAG: hypothetical protein J3R72DRAFT_11660 [Linnemannia gamsii]